MAYIHRINQQNDNREENIFLNLYQKIQKYRIPFISCHYLLGGMKNMIHPRQQNYCDMIWSIFCPKFKFLSITALIILTNISLFIACLASNGLLKTGLLLQIKYQTLRQFGSNVIYLTHRGQVYRLILPIFLHHDFLHLTLNSFFTLFMVAQFEYTYGSLIILIYYILCGIGGNIFTCVTSCNSNQSCWLKASVGSSTSLFGIIGLYVAYLFVNWSALSFLGQIFLQGLIKLRLTINLIILLLFGIIFSFSASNIDVFGHIGGFLTGVMAGMAAPTIMKTKREKYCMIGGIIFTVIYFLICFSVFFTRYNFYI